MASFCTTCGTALEAGTNAIKCAQHRAEFCTVCGIKLPDDNLTMRKTQQGDCSIPFGRRVLHVLRHRRTPTGHKWGRAIFRCDYFALYPFHSSDALPIR